MRKRAHSLSIRELIVKNKEEIINNKLELEQIEKRIEERVGSTSTYSTMKMKISTLK